MNQVFWLSQMRRRTNLGKPTASAGVAFSSSDLDAFRLALVDDAKPLAEVEWIDSVLYDVETFAGMNGLPRLCEQLRVVRQGFLEEKMELAAKDQKYPE